MRNGKNAVKTAAIVLFAAEGAYFLTGGALCVAALSRYRLNREPEEILNVPYLMKRYVQNNTFREADDWFVTVTPAVERMVIRGGHTLFAEVIRQKTVSDRWVVLCHGYTSRPRNMSLQAKHFYDKGYNILLPYLRGHRLDQRLFTTMGQYECKDVAQWLDYIVKENPNASIVLMGVSMGAATAMQTLKENIPQNVKCCIEDCGYSNCMEQFKEQFTNTYHLPEVPFLWAANSFSRAFLGWDFAENKPIEAVKQTDLPMLFIHGKDDRFVPFAMVHELYEACNSPKELLEVENAGHDQSCYKAPEIYWKTTDAFVEKYIR